MFQKRRRARVLQATAALVDCYLAIWYLEGVEEVILAHPSGCLDRDLLIDQWSRLLQLQQQIQLSLTAPYQDFVSALIVSHEQPLRIVGQSLSDVSISCRLLGVNLDVQQIVDERYPKSPLQLSSQFLTLERQYLGHRLKDCVQSRSFFLFDQSQLTPTQSRDRLLELSQAYHNK